MTEKRSSQRGRQGSDHEDFIDMWDFMLSLRKLLVLIRERLGLISFIKLTLAATEKG